MPTQRRASLMDNQRTELQPTHDAMLAWKSAISLYQCLPGLRGFWPGSATVPPSPSVPYINDFGGDYYRSMEYISANGGALFGYAGLVPWVRVYGAPAGGSGAQHCYAGDRANYRITGNEVLFQLNQRGLTFGIWMLFEAVNTWAYSVMGKDDGYVTPFSYYLEKDASHYARFVITENGTARIGVSSSDMIAANEWYLIIGRYYRSHPDTDAPEMAIFLNGVKSVSTTGVPTAIYNSGAALRVGYPVQTATLPVYRKWSMAFISAMALSDALCSAIWHHTRAMFGR